MRVSSLLAVLLTMGLADVVVAQAPSTPPPASSSTRPATPSASGAPARKAQTRPHGTRVVVDASKLSMDDGDTVDIQWSASDTETVRILGIDTPETRHVKHNLPYAQAFGAEARGFAMGAFATATKIELQRSETLDPFGRTLGYFFLDGRNYSVLIVRARLAEESITRYGDNGMPNQAAEVLAAAKAAGPVPFESPGEYRKRMRAVSEWMKANGQYPEE